MHYYLATRSFGAKGKKPVVKNYIVRSRKMLTPELLKQGITVTLINLRDGEATRERITLNSDIIIKRHDKPLTDQQVGSIILEKTERFQARLQAKVYG